MSKTHAADSHDLIRVHGARVNNLKDVSIEIPKRRLTVFTGMWGMNIPLPSFPGSDAVQFWWVFGIMIAVSLGMLAFFRRKGWI